MAWRDSGCGCWESLASAAFEIAAESGERNQHQDFTVEKYNVVYQRQPLADENVEALCPAVWSVMATGMQRRRKTFRQRAFSSARDGACPFRAVMAFPSLYVRWQA